VEGGGEGREVDHGAREGVDHADGRLAPVQEDEEAVGEADDPVGAELGEADAQAVRRARVEEDDLAAGAFQGRRVAVAERDPAARAEVRFA
jgi:hypothetical protein